MTVSTPPTATYRTPACIICGQVSRIELPGVTAAALAAGAPAQDVVPDLPRAEREQLISGTHPACWAATFGSPTGD